MRDWALRLFHISSYLTLDRPTACEKFLGPSYGVNNATAFNLWQRNLHCQVMDPRTLPRLKEFYISKQFQYLGVSCSNSLQLAIQIIYFVTSSILFEESQFQLITSPIILAQQPLLALHGRILETLQICTRGKPCEQEPMRSFYNCFLGILYIYLFWATRSQWFHTDNII